MDSIIDPGSRQPTVSADAKVNLDIRLEGWPGATAVGFLGAALVAICGLFLKFRS